MNQNEFKQWFKEVEQCFPEFCEWLERHDFQSMLRAYFDEMTRENVTLDEALFVLEGMHTGRIEGSPVGFERQRFLANLLNAVREKRSKEMHKQTQDSWRTGILGECKDIPIRSKIPNPSPLTGKMADLFRQLRSERIPAA